jgi:hypothetical protein
MWEARRERTLREKGISNGIPRNVAVKVWPTATVNGNYNRKGASATSGDGLQTAVDGKLNPDWVESLMGFPEGWTALPVTLGPADPPTRKRPGKRRAPSPAPSPIERPA